MYRVRCKHAAWCAGLWRPGGGLSGFFGFDTSLGDAWVLNPFDFSSGNPSTSPGTVIIRPVVTDQNGLRVEFSLTCLGCASLTGTSIAPIDKSNPANDLWQSPAPQSIYNYNPLTASASRSIPLYQGLGWILLALTVSWHCCKLGCTWHGITTSQTVLASRLFKLG